MNMHAASLGLLLAAGLAGCTASQPAPVEISATTQPDPAAIDRSKVRWINMTPAEEAVHVRFLRLEMEIERHERLMAELRKMDPADPQTAADMRAAAQLQVDQCAAELGERINVMRQAMRAKNDTLQIQVDGRKAPTTRPGNSI